MPRRAAKAAACHSSQIPLRLWRSHAPEGDPLQALPNFPAFNSNCTEGYWASIFKYTTASSSTCTGVRPTGLPVALGTVQLGEFSATGLTPSKSLQRFGSPLDLDGVP